MKIFKLQYLFLIALIGNANTLMIQPNPLGPGLAILNELPQILGQLHHIHEMRKQQEEQIEGLPGMEKSIHIPRFQNPFHFVKVFSQQMINNNNGQQEQKFHKIVQMRGRNGKIIEKDINKTVTPSGVFTSITKHPLDNQPESEERPNLFNALFGGQRDNLEERQQLPILPQKPQGFMFEIDIPLKKQNIQEDNKQNQKEVQDNTIDIQVENDKKNDDVSEIKQKQEEPTFKNLQQILNESDEEQDKTNENKHESTTQEEDHNDIPKLFDHLTFPKVHKDKHPKDKLGFFDLFETNPFREIDEEKEPVDIIPLKKHKKKHHKKVDFNTDDILNMFVDKPKHHKRRRKHKKNKLNNMEKEEVNDLIEDIVKSGQKKKLIDFLEKQDDKLIDDQLINESVKQALNKELVGSNDIFDRKLRALNPQQIQITNPGILSKSKIKAQFNYQ